MGPVEFVKKDAWPDTFPLFDKSCNRIFESI